MLLYQLKYYGTEITQIGQPSVIEQGVECQDFGQQLYCFNQIFPKWK